MRGREEGKENVKIRSRLDSCQRERRGYPLHFVTVTVGEQNEGDERRQLARLYSAHSECVVDFHSPGSKMRGFCCLFHLFKSLFKVVPG